MYCGKCGELNKDGSKFCRSCGESLKVNNNGINEKSSAGNVGAAIPNGKVNKFSTKKVILIGMIPVVIIVGYIGIRSTPKPKVSNSYQSSDYQYSTFIKNDGKTENKDSSNTYSNNNTSSNANSQVNSKNYKSVELQEAVDIILSTYSDAKLQRPLTGNYLTLINGESYYYFSYDMFYNSQGNKAFAVNRNTGKPFDIYPSSAMTACKSDVALTEKEAVKILCDALSATVKKQIDSSSIKLTEIKGKECYVFNPGDFKLIQVAPFYRLAVNVKTGSVYHYDSNGNLIAIYDNDGM